MAKLSCPYCGERVDRDAVLCPKCGKTLVMGDESWRESRIREKIDKAKHKANIYIISATVLVTLGLLGGWIVCMAYSSVGLFGGILVCLGIGCTASAERHELEARSLEKLLDARYEGKPPRSRRRVRRHG